MTARSASHVGRLWQRLLVLGIGCATASALVAGPLAARAVLPTGWTHDHSSAGIPARPNGYSGLVARFGQPCNGVGERLAIVLAIAVDAGGGRIHLLPPLHRP